MASPNGSPQLAATKSMWMEHQTMPSLRTVPHLIPMTSTMMVSKTMFFLKLHLLLFSKFISVSVLAPSNRLMPLFFYG